MKVAVARRNAALDTFTSSSASGKLRIYAGTRPTDPDTAIGAATLLVECTMNATAFPAASGGVLTANAIASGTAVATGTAAWARLWQSNGTTPLFDFSVTASGGGGEVQLTTVSIVTSATVPVASCTITMPVGT